MVNRPWVTPAEVKEYTEYPSVSTRPDSKLAVDISRAEQYVISYVNHDFAAYEELPQSVKTAIILLAEAYAYNACLTAKAGAMKSETFDDYSYTAADAEPIDINSVDIATLLDDFAAEQARQGITMRMRKL